MIEYWKNYKIEIYPTESQQTTIQNICHAFRTCFNIGLAYCKTKYANGEKFPTFIDMTNMLTEYRHTKSHSWLLQYNVATCRYAFKNVLIAYKRFFNDKSMRHPKFKSKKRDKMRFKVDGCKLVFKSKSQVHIPGLGIYETVYCGENHCIPINDTEYHNVYISFDKDRYWLSLSIKITIPIQSDELLPPGEPIGIDVGIKKSATLSNGKVYDPPNVYRMSILQSRADRLSSKIVNDKMRRKKIAACTKTKYIEVPKSKNELAREKLYRKTCKRISNIYKSHYHKISRDIANTNPSFVVLETIKMMDWARSDPYNKVNLLNSRMNMLIDFISYKCELNGSKIIYADPFYPSSQICSNCGKRTKIGSSRSHHCSYCGSTMDRDLNAAINLRNYGQAVVDHQPMSW